MSFKAIILLTRAESATHEQFADWWLKQHAPLAKQLPNLRKGVFNLVENPAEGDPDGVSELWFDTQADFEAAYAITPTWRYLSIVDLSSQIPIVLFLQGSRLLGEERERTREYTSRLG